MFRLFVQMQYYMKCATNFTTSFSFNDEGGKYDDPRNSGREISAAGADGQQEW